MPQDKSGTRTHEQSKFSRFGSRRSVVHSLKGMVASTQPLANAAGIRILDQGGNCVDAAVAVAAALCVTEPSSTGVGGDCFMLYHDKETKQVHGLNGCGKSAKRASIDAVKSDLGANSESQLLRIPLLNVHSVTVPGAIAGWIDSIEMWGSGAVSLADILAPAIDLAENGFIVSEIAAHMWRGVSQDLLEQSGQNAAPFLNEDGSFCQAGQIFSNKPLAKLLKNVVIEGKDGFYKGDVARKIVSKIKEKGGFMELDDLSEHTSKRVEPIFFDFLGKRLWEIPPNGQGIVALFALGYLKELSEQKKVDLKSMQHNSTEYLHLLIEALKLAFYESENFVADLDFHSEIDVKNALSKQRLAEKAKMLHPKKVLTRKDIDIVPDPMYKCDTVYFTVADARGNACSFINSVFSAFGSCIIPDDYGFALQSRGANFNLSHGAINSLEGGKRPYHTIIPSLITDTETNELFASVACMGGWEQPQAHVQIFLNMVLFGFTPQEALDAPRFCLEPNEEFRHLDVGKGSGSPVSTPSTIVNLEEGIPESVVEELKGMGHVAVLIRDFKRETFGRAQCIKNIMDKGRVAWAGGSDLRGDGAAVAQI